MMELKQVRIDDVHEEARSAVTIHLLIPVAMNVLVHAGMYALSTTYSRIDQPYSIL